MSVIPFESHPAVEALLREAATSVSRPLGRRERVVEATVGASLVAASVALHLAAPDGAGAFGPSALVLVVLYAVAHRVRFTVGAGMTAPTQLVLVPMLILLPPALVPLLVVAAVVLERLPDVLRRRVHADRLLLGLGDGWFAFGPALVLALVAPERHGLELWSLYIAAFLAQLLADMASATVREWLALGTPPSLQLRLLSLVMAIDAALAPLGLLTALAAREHPGALVIGMPLVGLLAMLAREREGRIENALELSVAYRGSALLLGEMLEADDEYTGGEHTQGVVALALAVGKEMRLEEREARDLEFAALLHDIGKLRTPDAIINKPGKLTEEEWAIVKRHPIDGQEMLDRIGGVLADVGRIVRGHHERWDGGGYPDGLVGEAIPLAARIICACDAYSAMTTTRSYRAAMPEEDALAELEACSGQQFDPAVVGALMTVVRRETPQSLVAALAA